MFNSYIPFVVFTVIYTRVSNTVHIWTKWGHNMRPNRRLT